MDATLKKRLIDTLRRIALAIEKGLCDEMSATEYDDLINALNKLKQVEENYTKPIRRWRFLKL